MQLKQTFQDVKEASRKVGLLPRDVINDVLYDVADALLAAQEKILAANRLDLDKMDKESPLYDRLQLTENRLQGIAADMRNVATLTSPLGHVQKSRTLPNGLRLKRVSVPFGVIGVVYEARPNVTFDVFSLCLKAGSACILKGGKDADNTNREEVAVIKEVLRRHDIDEHAVELLPATHEATAELLHANGYVDLVIPRGSSRLIQFVRHEASVPVIETGAGVCHTYFDEFGTAEMGAKIVFNAKTRRPSVCNSLDCLIIHQERLGSLPVIIEPLKTKRVEIFADETAKEVLRHCYPEELLHSADDETYGTEFMSLKMAVKTVDSLDSAIRHIEQYGSGHSECIVTDIPQVAEEFMNRVDAACVYWNAPTSFTDGAQFGMGAEIGISTQKLHARGPMALEEITTYKWLIEGDGQVRE